MARECVAAQVDLEANGVSRVRLQPAMRGLEYNWVQVRWVHMYLFGCRYAGFICIYLGAGTLGSYVFIWVQIRWDHINAPG